MNESRNWIVFFFKEKITLKHLKLLGHPSRESTFNLCISDTVSCQFHVRKFEFYWFFHGLRISETNNFRNDINKNNIKWFTTSSYVLVQFLQKTLCFDRNLLCFVSLYLPRSCLLLVAYNKTNIPYLFCLISKLFTLRNIIFNSSLRRWILITSGE